MLPYPGANATNPLDFGVLCLASVVQDGQELQHGTVAIAILIVEVDLTCPPVIIAMLVVTKRGLLLRTLQCDLGAERQQSLTW